MAGPDARCGRHPNRRVGPPPLADGHRRRGRCRARREAGRRGADPQAGLALRVELRLDRHGVLHLAHGLRNTGTDAFVVGSVRVVLPLPPAHDEVLDLTGRWCRERSPQRHRVPQGTWLRETRRGRTGHDASLVLAAGTRGFGFRTGSVHALHLAWSGDAKHFVERTPEGQSHLGAAELLGAGEVVLSPGEAYETPQVWAAWSDRGLDGLADRWHAAIRDREQHPRTPVRWY